MAGQHRLQHRHLNARGGRRLADDLALGESDERCPGAGGRLPADVLPALPAGALVDIVNKRRYLLGVQLWMAAVAMLLAVLTLLGLTTVWLLLAGHRYRADDAGLERDHTELVGKHELPAAVGLSSVGVNLARAVGPAIAPGRLLADLRPQRGLLLRGDRRVGDLDARD